MEECSSWPCLLNVTLCHSVRTLIRFLNSIRSVFVIVCSSWRLVLWLNRIEWTCQNSTWRTPVNMKVSAVVAGRGLLLADRKTPTITLTPALSPRHPCLESHTVRPNIGRLPSSSSRLSYQPGSTETRSTDRLWPRADGGFDTTVSEPAVSTWLAEKFWVSERLVAVRSVERLRAWMESVHNGALVCIYSDWRLAWDNARCLLPDIREIAVRKVLINQSV